MFDNAERTELGSMGEFALIEHLTKLVKLNQPSTVKGIGDDAAVLRFEDQETVITTDLLLEGVHFDLGYVPLKHLGYKAIAVNVSDVCAMHATPTQVTVGIGVSNRFSVEALEELYAGMLLACEKYNVDLVGGDTSSSAAGLTISVTAIGTVESGKAVYRKGANEHDLICVTGDLGAAYMGLQVLEREKAVFKDSPNTQPDLSGYDYILERQLKPEAKVFLKPLLEKAGVAPTAMIDVSDGLASELLHLAKASACGIQVYEEKLPIDFGTSQAADDFKLAETIVALNGGEDYELLFTISPSDYEQVEIRDELSIIGHITDASAGCNLVGRGGDQIELKAQGWNAFAKHD